MKTAVVTGASRGIGAEIAKSLAQEGYTVCINYLKSHDMANKLSAQIDADAFCADVSDYIQVAKMIDAMMQKWGKIDLLVNNAAVSVSGLFTDISDEAVRRLFDVNVMGMFNCVKAVLPLMIERKKGKIINISSMWGEVGASCEVHYSASKAAVIGFTKALAKEVGPSGIQVNCITPGVINTDMNSHLDRCALDALMEDTPLCRIGTPKDVADAVCFLASDSADFITGQILGVSGGFVV